VKPGVRIAAALAAWVALLPAGVLADNRAAMALNLLDYIAVDYPGAVERGQVKNADEYREMTEFASEVATLVESLPEHPARAGLVVESGALVAQVAAKAEAADVAAAANRLRAAVMRVYQVSVSPRRTPDPALGAKLFAQHCASCHGLAGHGDGVAAKGMAPPPSDFHDRERMDKRSAFGLYNTITLGVKGTAMASFETLPEDGRWALAFHVAALAVPDALRARGEAAWTSGNGRTEFSTLAPVATLSRAEVAARHGEEGVAVQAYLLAHPEAMAKVRGSPIDFAIDKLAASVAAYQAGERPRASQLAIQAYLEGFELVEAALSNLDAELVRRTERAMMDYRAGVQSGAPMALVELRARDAEVLLAEARARLAGGALSPLATFTAALVILLREGLEAVLVLAAIFAFLDKAGRNDAKRYVHFGWIAALALGALTWVVSSQLIEISGASREVTEGVTALAAAAMLLYVGFWLHDKAHSMAWKNFIRAQVGDALTSGTVKTLAAVSFLAVYREAFETVLFYQSLASQAGPEGHSALVAGVGVGALALAVLTWAILRYSARVPLGPFFAVTAVLLAMLAVVFTGQGIAALQEASWIDAGAVSFVRIPMLGIYPTWQSLAAQALVALVIVGAAWWGRLAPRKESHH
jgi:high-affinity iron transporter